MFWSRDEYDELDDQLAASESRQVDDNVGLYGYGDAGSDEGNAAFEDYYSQRDQDEARARARRDEERSRDEQDRWF